MKYYVALGNGPLRTGDTNTYTDKHKHKHKHIHIHIHIHIYTHKHTHTHINIHKKNPESTILLFITFSLSFCYLIFCYIYLEYHLIHKTQMYNKYKNTKIRVICGVCDQECDVTISKVSSGSSTGKGEA